MEKPKYPTPPNRKDYPDEKFGRPKDESHPYIKAYRKWTISERAYWVDLEIYEQIKMIRLVKNSTEKYCLKALTIKRKQIITNGK